mmetsp:Transcript_39727/g.38298  ORF Transcript_39727/g.38298 Transcript_39727/m.38298 type:complete len:129 (-) Transcript_39727:177-563(-)
MKKVLKKALSDLEFEIYFYCLGMIPPLASGKNLQFVEHNFCQLLVDQLTEFYNNNKNYVHLTSPLFLALRALIFSNEQIKKQLVTQNKKGEILDLAIDISLRTYQVTAFRSIYITSTLLILEVGAAQV